MIGSRVHTGELLSRIRSIMTDETRPQSRMDQMVVAIAEALGAGVCSIYLRRSDDTLELYATHGLDQGAVHLTRMQPGEGLVGEVVRTHMPLNLAEAGAHPCFSLHPETGEAVSMSFLGVPILRAGRTLGVLVVQDARTAEFRLEELEALQNIAMVLAEIAASGELLAKEVRHVPVRAASQRSFSARIIVEGLAQGRAVLFEPHVTSSSRLATDEALELQRLQDGLRELRTSLDRLFLGHGHALGEPTREVMQAFSMFARDQGWQNRLEEAVAAGLTAEAAVERVRSENRQRMLRARDPYLRERLHDLDDLANRLLRHLGGVTETGVWDEDTVLIARNLGPVELLEQDPAHLKAVVLEEGSRNSHAAIVASALRIPMVGGVSGVLAAAADGNEILVDAETGRVIVRPLEETRAGFAGRVQHRDQASAKFAQLRDLPAITLDGVQVELNLNAGLLIDLPRLAETGADGIGLFRTEFQFMLSQQLPKQQDLMKLYGEVLARAGDKPVVFRTLDLGGDKILPYVAQEREANPAMGWRAVRMALDKPGMFRYQLRALMRAAQGRTLRIMFPLVSTVAEFRRAREMAEGELARLRRFGHEDLPTDLKIGAMIETPSLAMDLPALLRHADFASLGANDLMQAFFAADRDNPRVADRYDPLQGSALTLLRQVAEDCEAAGKPVTVCGEMASREVDALVLLALGYRRLSVTAANVGPLKYLIRSVRLDEIRQAVLSYSPDENMPLRELLRPIVQKAKKIS